MILQDFLWLGCLHWLEAPCQTRSVIIRDIRHLSLVQSSTFRMTKSCGKQCVICVYIKQSPPALRFTRTYYAQLKISLSLAFQMILESQVIYQLSLSHFSGIILPISTYY